MRIDTTDANKREDEDYESDDGGIEDKIKEVSHYVRSHLLFLSSSILCLTSRISKIHRHSILSPGTQRSSKSSLCSKR